MGFGHNKHVFNKILPERNPFKREIQNRSSRCSEPAFETSGRFGQQKVVGLLRRSYKSRFQ